jgi:hypothetical protein
VPLSQSPQAFKTGIKVQARSTRYYRYCKDNNNICMCEILKKESETKYDFYTRLLGIFIPGLCEKIKSNNIQL